MRCLLVPGTWSAFRGRDEREWWYRESKFCADVLRPLGLTPQPILWSTNVNGGPRWPWQWFRHRTFPDWMAGAEYLAHTLRERSYDERVVLAHSHGGQVAAIAAAQVPIRLLITVSTPVRLGDMLDAYRRARQHAEFWVHVHSDDSDRMQFYGAICDGHFGVTRANPYAHENVYVPRKGHSRILNDPLTFEFWRQSGITGHLADCLRPPCKGDADV